MYKKIAKLWDSFTELFRLAGFENKSKLAKLIFNNLINPLIKAYKIVITAMFRSKIKVDKQELPAY